jgi:hypothetical protein
VGLSAGADLRGDLAYLDLMGYDVVYYVRGSALGVTVGRPNGRQLRIIYRMAVGSYRPGPAP